MATATTLILISVLTGGNGVPGTHPQLQQYPSMQACKAVLQATLEGQKSAFNANVLPAHQDAKIAASQDGRWLVLTSGMGRLVAQGRCE